MYTVYVDEVTSVSRIHAMDCSTYVSGHTYPILRDAIMEGKSSGNCVRLCGHCRPDGGSGCVCREDDLQQRPRAGAELTDQELRGVRRGLTQGDLTH